MRFTKSAWTAGVMAALITACAGPGQKASSPEELVSARAQARWEAQLAGQWGQAYSYLTPGHRSGETKELYTVRMQNKPVQWTAARVLGTNCPEERVCEVDVSVAYVVHNPMASVDRMGNERVVDETWLHVDGEWYYKPE